MRALGRRAWPTAPPVMERAGVQLDPARHEVTRDGQMVALSRKEFTVLDELLRAGSVQESGIALGGTAPHGGG